MTATDPEEALGAWAVDGQPRVVEDGLINRTWFVVPSDGGEPRAVLQWVNPIFDPRIQDDLVALVDRLTAFGLITPRPLETRDGSLAVDDGGGFWRLLTYVPGTTHHRLDSAARARAAGFGVGRFHRAVAGWSYRPRAPRRDIHDTPARMAELATVLDGCDGHPLAGPARELGRAVLDAWNRWDGSMDLPERFAHGDLKVSNLRFDGVGERVVCLLDLDTIGPQTLAAEMGDAWRSWCNPAAEDEPDRALLDLDRFAASARGWLDGLAAIAEKGEGDAFVLTADERASLVPGIERIALELSARFCADAVEQSYFKEDRRRFPTAGTHNLARARGQWRLALSAGERRAACERILEGNRS
ncbi:MAG: aminoglycoside phosphotransferase family protein [Acidobacteriota bacterium]